LTMSFVVTNLSPVNHDGKLYEEGQEIPGLSSEQATPLLALGVIQETAPPAPPEKPTAK
jgi:hypothetical protein